MKAVQFDAPHSIVVAEVADPEPGPREVVVAPAATGLCGTDLHVLEGDLGHGWPIIPGHELAGEVVAVGSGVTEVRIGDQVGVDPSLYCGECYYCRRAQGNQCERWGSLGVTAPGGAAELVAVPVAGCVVLPGGVDPATASLIEPLACAVRGYDVVRVRTADHVLVLGAGTMGLMMLELAKRAGAATVSVVETNASRRARAAALGCTAAAAAVRELDRPRGWDVVIDCTGVPAAIEAGIDAVGRAGTFLQFGVTRPGDRVSVDPYRIYNREITISGSMAVLHSYERAVDLFAAGAIDPEVFITDRFPLASYAAAVDAFRAGGSLKIQVVP